MYGKLSNPMNIEGDFQNNIDRAYSYFSEHINNRENRPTLYDKNIYVEAHEIIDERPSGFWHIISLEEKHKFWKFLPCNNESAMSKCNQNCNNGNNSIEIKYGSECRNLCLYRASRIHWVVEIIELANKMDSDLQVWLKPGNNNSNKLYLRYNKEGADFVVIFSAEKKFYRLISAFPVFYLSEKENFEKEYALYKWEYSK